MRMRRVRRLLALLSLLVPAGSAFGATTLPPSLQAYSGRVIYLDFWASWCGPCARSFPWLNSLKARYGDRLQVVAVNVDEKHAEAEQFLKLHPAGFPVIYDPAGQIADFYHIQGMPSAVILDEQGRVEHQHIGFRDEEVGAYEIAIRSAVSGHSAGSP